MLNGRYALEWTITDLAAHGILSADADRLYFIRPVEDSKEIAGTVMSGSEIVDMAKSVMTLKPEELINGSLSPSTVMLIDAPKNIQTEWRIGL